MLNLIKQAIEREMQQYASELQVELETKYVKEFNERLSKHRNKLVLDAVEAMKIEVHNNDLNREFTAVIKL